MGQKEIIRRGPSYVFEVLFQPNGMENFSAEVVAAADAKTERTVKQIEKALQAPTRWFDSHPSEFDRITAARAKNYPGIFHLSLPAWHLYPRLNPNPE
jgi:ABC-type nitrate/sulfonate/bicarbonate transport system substrate-binding protein